MQQLDDLHEVSEWAWMLDLEGYASQEAMLAAHNGKNNTMRDNNLYIRTMHMFQLSAEMKGYEQED